jgi:hypothetical protein
MDDDETPDQNDTMPDQPQQPAKPDWSAIINQQWSQADDISLQKLMNGAAYIRDKANSGEHGPETTAALTDQLNDQLGPMIQRKQAAQQAASAEATQAALHQQAQAQAIQTANAAHAARAFPSSVAQHVDGQGNETNFVPDGKGGWTQIDKPDPGTAYAHLFPGTQDAGDDASQERLPEVPDEQTERPPQQAPIGADGQTLSTQPRFRDVMGADGVVHHQRIPTLDEFNGAQAVGTGTQVIRNGPYTEVRHNGQLVSTNRPQPQATQLGGKYAPNHDELEGYRAIAQHAVAGIQNPRVREAEFGKIMGSMVSRHVMGKMQDEKQTAIAQRQQTGIAAKEKAQQATEKGKLWDSVYQSKLGELQKEWDGLRKDGGGGLKQTADNAPGWAKDRESMEAEAEQRADRDYLRAHGHLPPAREAVRNGSLSPKSDNGPPVAAQPAAQPATPNGKDVNAEIERVKAALERAKAREAAKRPSLQPDPNPSTGFRTISKFD